MVTILYLHHVSSIGGASFCLLSILKNIDRTLIRPIVLLRSSGPLKDEIERMGIDVFLFPEMWQVPYNKSLINLHTIRGYYMIYRSLSIFSALLKKIKIDVVHINTMMLYPYLKVAKENGLKTIIHIREHWPIYEHRFQLKFAQDHIYRYADKVIAINTYSASIFPLASTTIIYDWIEMNERYKEMPVDNIFEEDMSKNKLYLFVGGIQKIKGTLEVLKVFNEYIKDSNSRLLLVGSYACSYKNRSILSKLCNLRNYIYENRVNTIINSDTRICVIPSTYNLKHLMEQAYCNVSYFTIAHANLSLAECIICGTVPLAKKTEESMEYSLGGKLAILCDNFEDFKNKWINIDKHYPITKDNIKKSSKYVEEMFSKQVNIKKLEILYNNI